MGSRKRVVIPRVNCSPFDGDLPSEKSTQQLRYQAKRRHPKAADKTPQPTGRERRQENQDSEDNDRERDLFPSAASHLGQIAFLGAHN